MLLERIIFLKIIRLFLASRSLEFLAFLPLIIFSLKYLDAILNINYSCYILSMHRIGGNFSRAAQWRLKFPPMHWRDIQLSERWLMKNKTRPRKALDILTSFSSRSLHVNDHITGSPFSDISFDICLSRIVATSRVRFPCLFPLASILEILDFLDFFHLCVISFYNLFFCQLVVYLLIKYNIFVLP